MKKGFVIKIFNWNEEKNKIIKRDRQVCFEDFLISLSENKLLDILPHPDKEKYPNQKIFIVIINNYTYYVPFVENDEEIFLKNIIPSRKYHKKYRSSK